MCISLNTRRFIFSGFAALLLMSACVTSALGQSTGDDHDTMPNGARVFADRCVLCHGNYGAGDGFMSLVISDYPDTSLLKTTKRVHYKELQNQVMLGGTSGQMNPKSPPWNDELSLPEMKAVAQFINTLQETPKQAWRSLDKYLANKPVSMETGRLVYKTRCESCHGATGSGDGPMSVIIKTPPPTNLTVSGLSKTELGRIISLGGTKVSRSGQMPAWETELTQVQIDSVVAYVLQFRR